jgi:hypothetical protein
MRAHTTAMILLGLGLGACRGDEPEPCTLDADLGAGCGLVMGDAELRLGDSLDAMVEAHGEPGWVDLGAAGSRFDYTEKGVTGFSSDGLTVSSLLVASPYTGATVEGLALGVEELEVPRTISAGNGSPFLPILWFPELGIGFESAEGAVVRIHLFPIQEAW